MLTEISGVEEPPTDFTDAHRWLGYVGFSHGIHRIHSKLGCVRDCVGTAGCHTLLHLCKSVLSVGVPPFALLVQQRLLHHLGLHPCHLWKAISRMWVRGYGRMPYPPMTLRLAVLGDSLFDEHFELLAKFGVVLQQSLCSVATLRQFRAVVAVPRARLLDDAVLYAEVYHLANL